MGEYGDLYAAGRQRLTAYVGGLDDAQLAAPVPATPEWDVKDIVSHMTGIMADLAAGDFEKAAEADRQAEERRGAEIGAILDEWAASAPTIEAGIDEFPYEMGAGPLLGDMTVHEGDIRAALGDAPIDDEAFMKAALRYYGGKLEGRIGEGGLPALRIQHDGLDHVLG
ncbi:MAG: maleylpyruvate isomerase family mycothiol-dependent enzyme, partial [Ilumatobacteraceae bacterium]